MIEFTEIAKAKVRQLLKGRASSGKVIRLTYPGNNQVQVVPMELKDLAAEDAILKLKIKKFLLPTTDFFVVLGKAALQKLAGAKINYLGSKSGEGVFEVFHREELEPAAPSQSTSLQFQKIQELLKNDINPAIGMHGGFAELLDVKDNIVYLKMGGGCQGCASSALTLRQGIETKIKELLPEIVAVHDQTDHAAGTNPYFKTA